MFTRMLSRYRIVTFLLFSSAWLGLASQAVADSNRLGGISTRSYVGNSPENYMIAGVFVNGSAKKVVVRASSVDGILNPNLTIKSYPAGTVLFSNTDWVTGVSATELSQTENGKWKPAKQTDAALIVTLQPGLYTMEVAPESSPGVGIIEVYELNATAKLGGISTRSYVGTNPSDYMIAGVFVQGDPKKLIVRGSSVDGVLNPKLTIKSYPDGKVLFENTDWVSGVSASELRTLENGKWKPGRESDATLIVTLNPGLYTLEVSPESSPGVGIVEVYEHPLFLGNDTIPIVTSSPIFSSPSNQIGGKVEFPQTFPSIPMVQSIVISNKGNATLKINSVVFSGVNKDEFKLQTLLPSSIEPNNEDKLWFSCNPSSTVGVRTATVQIATNDPKQATVSYTLQCAVVSGAAFSSSSHPIGTPVKFDEITLGSSIVQNINVINNGASTLNVNSIRISGTNAVDFTISSPTLSVDAGNSNLLEIRCKPSDLGVRNATLEFTTNDTKYPVVTYPLQCPCIAQPTPVFYSFSHRVGSTIEFSQTSPGTSVTQNIVFLNGGNSTLNLSSVIFTGINQNEFTLQTPLPLNIEPNMEGKLLFSCNPLVVGTRKTTVQVTTNDPKQPTVSYTLECPSVASPPKVEITPTFGSVINFTQVTVNTTVNQNIVIVNRGSSDLEIGSSVDKSIFKISPANIVIAPNTTQTLTVQCTPTMEGTNTANLQLLTNDPKQPIVSYTLQCAAIPCTGICIESTPKTGTVIDFSRVVVQTTNTQNIAINNFSSTYLNINSVNVIGNSIDFVALNPIPLVKPNSSQNIEVKCTPFATGLRTATLQIAVTDSVGASKVVYYPLQCVGIDSCNPNLQSRPDQSKYIAIVGDGYDADRDIFKPTSCAAGTITDVGSWKANLQLTSFKTFEEVVKSLNVKVKGGFFAGFFGGGGKVKFSTYSKETSFSQSFTLSYDIEGPNKRLSSLYLSDFGKQFKDNPSCFKQACGNQFVCQQTQVGKLYVNMQFQFKTEEQKKEFSGKAFVGGIGFFGCGCLPVGGFLSTKINGFSSALRQDGSVKISLYQDGGDATQITKILGNGDDVPSLSCSLTNLKACEDAIERVVKYTQDPSFISGMKANPAVGENVYCGYDSVGVFNVPTEVTTEIEGARIRLASESEYRNNVLERIKFLLTLTTLTADQKKALEDLKPKIEGDIAKLRVTEQVCFSNLASCVSEVDGTLSRLTTIDTAVLNPVSPKPVVCTPIRFGKWIIPRSTC